VLHSLVGARHLLVKAGCCRNALSCLFRTGTRRGNVKNQDCGALATDILDSFVGGFLFNPRGPDNLLLPLLAAGVLHSNSDGKEIGLHMDGNDR